MNPSVSDGYVLFEWCGPSRRWHYKSGQDGCVYGFDSIGAAIQKFCRIKKLAEADIECVVDTGEVYVYRILKGRDA